MVVTFMEIEVLLLVNLIGLPNREEIIYPCSPEHCVGTFFLYFLLESVKGSVSEKSSVGPIITFFFVLVGFLS